MNLEILQGRLKEIEAAIINVANQHNALIGHKTEVEFWISELMKAAPVVEEVVEHIANTEEVPVE
jgi:hypothetical protein